MGNKLTYSLLSVFSVLALVFGVMAVSGGLNPASPVASDSIGYKGSVCIYKNGELVECDHNVLYNTGADMVKDTLISPAGAVDYIELCNSTAGCGTPVAAKSETYNAYAACGLSAAQGTTTVLGQTGNWTVTKTFTSTCDSQTSNVTRLQNSSGDDLAGNTFSEVTLNNNDQLTVNWTLQVS